MTRFQTSLAETWKSYADLHIWCVWLANLIMQKNNALPPLNLASCWHVLTVELCDLYYIYICLYLYDDDDIYICVCIFTFIYNNLYIYIYLFWKPQCQRSSVTWIACVCPKAEAQVAKAIPWMKCVATVCRYGLWIMWSTRPLRADLQFAWSGGISQDETTVES